MIAAEDVGLATYSVSRHGGDIVNGWHNASAVASYQFHRLRLRPGRSAGRLTISVVTRTVGMAPRPAELAVLFRDLLDLIARRPIERRAIAADTPSAPRGRRRQVLAPTARPSQRRVRLYDGLSAYAGRGGAIAHRLISEVIAAFLPLIHREFRVARRN